MSNFKRYNLNHDVLEKHCNIFRQKLKKLNKGYWLFSDRVYQSKFIELFNWWRVTCGARNLSPYIFQRTTIITKVIKWGGLKIVLLQSASRGKITIQIGEFNFDHFIYFSVVFLIIFKKVYVYISFSMKNGKNKLFRVQYKKTNQSIRCWVKVSKSLFKIYFHLRNFQYKSFLIFSRINNPFSFVNGLFRIASRRWSVLLSRPYLSYIEVVQIVGRKVFSIALKRNPNFSSW